MGIEIDLLGSTPPRATLKTANSLKLTAFLDDQHHDWQQIVAPTKSKPYTLAKIVHHGHDITRPWWVTFYAWDVAKNKKVRKRVHADINDHKTVIGRLKAAEHVVRIVNAQLIRGMKLGTDKTDGLNLKAMLLTQLIAWAMDEKKSKNYSADYYRKFNAIIFNLNEWYQHTGIAPYLAKDFGHEEASNFFDYLRNERKLANKTLNNYRNDLATIFNYCEKRRPGSFKKNPVALLEQLPTYSKKHAAFSDADLSKILTHCTKRKTKDNFLLFVQFIYYLLARPKEVRALRIGDVDLVRQRVLFRAEISKNKRDEYVAMPPAFVQIIKASALHKHDASLYIFGDEYCPGPAPIGRHYYSKVNAQVLKALKLNQKDYTLYGYKHSGAVALYRATKDIKLVQSQCRHTSSTQTDIYLRDLGEMTNYNGLEKFKGSL